MLPTSASQQRSSQSSRRHDKWKVVSSVCASGRECAYDRKVECHSRFGSLSYPVSFLNMVSWLEVAQTQYCCSRLPDRARLRTPWRDFTGQPCRSPAAPRCQAVHQGTSRTRCLTVSKASASVSQDISTAGRQPHAEPHRFEKLNWTQQREAALRSEGEDEHPQMLPEVRTIDESGPRRHPYHRKLLAALSRSSVLDVEDILQTMQEDNLEPGPLAYNTLVVAHIKAGDLDAAFDVLQNLQYQGLQPVPQTYCALIHSSVRNGQLKQAEEVLQQMQDSQISAYSGWLVITKQLWAKGHIDLAQNYLKERPKEWGVDGDLYEHAIRQVCLDPSNDASYLLHPNFVDHVVSASGQPEMQELPAEANEVSPEGTVQKIWTNMQANQVPIEARHCNLLLGLFAETGNAKLADKTLKDMESGGLAQPNAASFEYMAEAHAASDEGHLDEELYGVTMRMTKLGLQPTKRMHSLGMEAALRANNLEMALNKLKGMREAGLGIMQLLSDSVLASLLWKLSCNNRPADLLRTLKTMQRDNKYLSPGPHNEQDEEGRSFLTAWLAAKPRATVQGFQGFPQGEQAAGHITEVDGIKILRNKYVINDADKIVAPSNMTIPQFKAELTARKLSVEGKRDELKKRVTAARLSDPPDIAWELHKRQDARKNKQKKQAVSEKAKRAAQEKGGQESKTNVKFMTWGSGGVVKAKDEEVAVVKDAEEGVVVEDDEGDADTPEMTLDDPMQPQTAVASEEYNDEARDGLNDDDDINIEDGRSVAVNAAAAPVQQTFTNQNAGVDAALQLMLLTQTLGGKATAADYRTLLEAVEHEGNANVAWSLVRSWHQTIQDAHDTKTVGSFYNRALAVCQQASNPDLVAEVMRTMQQNGIAVQSATLSEA